MMFWGWVVDLGLKRKDWELARGLNAKGEPLPGIAAATRKNRKSEMTPSGKGDPRAPYLMPGRGLSRTRSLLAGKAHADYAEFFWRYDAWTGDQWGRVLAYHARRGKAYDVVGLSPKGVAWVAAQAAKRWRAFQAGRYVEPVGQPARVAAGPSPSSPPPGRTNLDFATFGIGGSEDQARRAIAEGRSSGFMGAEEWAAYFRSRRPALRPAMGQSPSVSRGRSNVILQSIWNVPSTPPPMPMQRAAMPPAAPPRPKPKARPLAEPAASFRVEDGTPAEVARAAAVALRAVGKVHGAVGLPEIVVDADAAGSQVGYMNLFARRISLKADAGPIAPHVVAHEVGHVVDYFMIGEARGREGFEEALAAWREAVESTRRIAGLRARRAEADREGEARRGESRYLAYSLGSDEVWARAYAQWIAVESGDEEALESFLAMVQADSRYQTHYWYDDDFEPVAAAFRALFRLAGWLR